jgi:uncharacterized integral membrane protein
MRKLFLTGFLLLLPHHLNFLRLVLALLASISYLVLLGVARPLKQRSTSFLNIVLNLSLCFAYVAALLIKVIDFADSLAGSDKQQATRFFGWTSPYPLTVVILCLNFGVLLIALLVFAHGLREQRKRHSLLSVDERSKLLMTMRHVSNANRSDLRSRSGNGIATSFPFATAFRGSKHEDHAKDLITGQPLNAALGLTFFMGVSDTVADDGIQRIVDEVARFVKHVRNLRAEDVQDRYAGFVRAPSGTSAADLVAKMIEEVQGNLEYILHQPSEEKEYHNGTRDLGRAFGNFCLEREFRHLAPKQQEVARNRALGRKWPADFALRQDGKIYRRHRRQWEALSIEEQRRYAVRFEDFLKHPHAREAWLSPAHVLCLRLYTTHAFKYLNGPLRDSDHYGQGKQPHPFPLIVNYIAEGIKKMRAVYIINNKDAAATTITLWRGMKQLKVCWPVWVGGPITA